MLTSELSELPFQAPTASAYSPFVALLGAGGADVAVGVEVPGVVVGAGLERRRPAPVPPSVIANWPQNGFTLGFVLPARMSVTIPAAPASSACVGLGRRGRSDELACPCRRYDREDRRLVGEPAAVRERAVGAHEVHGVDLLDAQREREPGVDLAVAELDAHRLGLRLDRVVADDGHRLHGRDVEREPQRVSDADGAALEVVGVGRACSRRRSW